MSRHSISAAVLCGVLGWGLANLPEASASDLQVEQSQRGLRVTYLLYSGRPNPVVLVTDPAQVRAIEERLSQVQARGERVTRPESPAVLGYTGILIERVGARGADSEPLVLRDDVLRARASGASTFQGTASREVAGLEGLLLELGREQKVLGDGELSFIRQSR
jgi:hypothetical protein